MNIADLIAETDGMKSEDVRQEYLLLRLEGRTPAEATAQSGAADPLASRNRQRGPLVNDQRPIVSDFREYTHLTSHTLDVRSDIERDSEWAAVDAATCTVNSILDRLPAGQAEALRTIYGLGTGQPMSWREAAETMGVKTTTISSRMWRARENMQKIADSWAASTWVRYE